MAANQTNSSLVNYLQNDDHEAAQELEALLSSLPQASFAFPMYKYQGYWHPSTRICSSISFQNHFQAKDSDIVLVTFPKSGTTWLKALAFTTIYRAEHNVRSPKHPLLLHNPQDVVPFVDIDMYRGTKDPDLSILKNPRLFATHLPFLSLPPSVRDSACKFVYLCRNPKDTFVSVWHFVRKWIVLNPADQPDKLMKELFDKFCEGVSFYGPYWDHVLEYWEKSLEMPKRFLFLKYEDLKEQPLLYLRKLAAFLECPFSSEEEASGLPHEILRLCSFDHLSKLEVNKNGNVGFGVPKVSFFRRGEVGDWQNSLSDEMIKRLDDLSKQKFLPSGLKF